MKIKEIIEHYKDLKEWAYPICFRDVSTDIIRGLIDEISSIEDELISKYGDKRITLKNELYLKYIFYDLEILKSELCIVILERDGEGFTFWFEWWKKCEYRKLDCLAKIRKLEEQNNEKSLNDM